MMVFILHKVFVLAEKAQDSVNSSFPSLPPGAFLRKRFVWKAEHHRKFLAAIKSLEHSSTGTVTPCALLAILRNKIEGLTRDIVASHLQKYRQQKEREEVKRALNQARQELELERAHRSGNSIARPSQLSTDSKPAPCPPAVSSPTLARVTEAVPNVQRPLLPLWDEAARQQIAVMARTFGPYAAGALAAAAAASMAPSFYPPPLASMAAVTAAAGHPGTSLFMASRPGVRTALPSSLATAMPTLPSFSSPPAPVASFAGGIGQNSPPSHSSGSTPPIRPIGMRRTLNGFGFSPASPLPSTSSTSSAPSSPLSTPPPTRSPSTLSPPPPSAVSSLLSAAPRPPTIPAFSAPLALPPLSAPLPPRLSSPIPLNLLADAALAAAESPSSTSTTAPIFTTADAPMTNVKSEAAPTSAPAFRSLEEPIPKTEPQPVGTPPGSARILLPSLPVPLPMAGSAQESTTRGKPLSIDELASDGDTSASDDPLGLCCCIPSGGLVVPSGDADMPAGEITAIPTSCETAGRSMSNKHPRSDDSEEQVLATQLVGAKKMREDSKDEQP